METDRAQVEQWIRGIEALRKATALLARAEQARNERRVLAVEDARQLCAKAREAVRSGGFTDEEPTNNDQT